MTHHAMTHHEIGECLLSMQPLVILSIRKRRINIPLADQLDCWSEGAKVVLEQKLTEIDDIRHVLLTTAISNAFALIQSHHIDTLSSRPREPRIKIDFRNIPLELCSALTDNQLKIFLFRRNGLKVTHISRTLNKSVSNICVECYIIRRRWAVWHRRTEIVTQDVVDKLPNNNHWKDVAYMRYIQSHDISDIARSLNIQSNYVRQIIYNLRRYLLKNRGIKIP